MSSPRYIARFDSSSAMMRSLAAFLAGEDFPRLGSKTLHSPVLRAVSALPSRQAEAVYRLGGWYEALPPERLDEVDEQEISSWVAGAYPRRPYPAVALGASNGAAVHLCTALGIPWLPQTVLVQLRRTVDVDDLSADLDWGREHGADVVARNPGLRLHHMSDPSQDRLMLPRMGYFRFKRLRLGRPERRFLQEALAPGGTLLVVDCRKQWPLLRLGDRHWYQPGGPGGTTPEEYVHGGHRVAAFLRERGSQHRTWTAPQPLQGGPESEWGFAPALLDDLRGLARRHGWRIRRLVFEDPDDLSPLVADMYRRWYASQGRPTGRLHVPTDFLLEPYWTIRTASVPYWVSFSVEPAALALEQYLDSTNPYEEIRVTLFSHGVESIGYAPVRRWRRAMSRATRRHGFLGTDPRRFPRDFLTFVRYHSDLRRLRGHWPLPPALPLRAVDDLLDDSGDRYAVRVEDEAAEAAEATEAAEAAEAAEGDRRARQVPRAG